jgi:uncharacterized Fe-S cluster-containing MiaB family protein
MNKILTILAIVFSTIGCSYESKVNGLAANYAVAVKTPAPAENRIRTFLRVIGTFSNVKSDGEHESGYSVRLWAMAKSLLD